MTGAPRAPASTSHPGLRKYRNQPHLIPSICTSHLGLQGAVLQKQFGRLRSPLHLEDVSLEVPMASEDCCVSLRFVSELPGLFIRTINHFPLDLQFFAYAAATL